MKRIFKYLLILPVASIGVILLMVLTKTFLFLRLFVLPEQNLLCFRLGPNALQGHRHFSFNPFSVSASG